MSAQQQPDYITDTGLKVIRTPENCFHNLKDYNFQPHYAMIDGIRMHYLDENSTGSTTIVMLHGEPSWSYLYRKMIPVLSSRGYRVIVPDLIGFGKSDKPMEKKAYSYAGNVAWVKKFLFEHLKLSEINFVVHDWGGLIGLRIVAEHPEKFARVIAMNTAFPRLEGFNPLYILWRTLWIFSGSFSYSSFIPIAMKMKPSKETLQAYDAPFPAKAYKAAPFHFPSLVPVFPWHREAWTNRRLWKKLQAFDKPFLTVCSAFDPFTKGAERHFKKYIAGAQQQPHVKIKSAGHFLQEDQPGIICSHIITFIEKNQQD